jgi:hypothetical protein
MAAGAFWLGRRRRIVLRDRGTRDVIDGRRGLSRVGDAEGGGRMNPLRAPSDVFDEYAWGKVFLAHHLLPVLAMVHAGAVSLQETAR